MPHINTDLKVTCYAGYRGEEEPREFSIGERNVQVVEVHDRWISPDHQYFKVRRSDGDTYILRHNVTSNLYRTTMRSYAEKISSQNAALVMMRSSIRSS